MKTKLKTNKTAKKRFSITATGKIRHCKTGLNHLMQKKNSSRRRQLLAGDELYKGDRKRISRMLGEGA
ncbi:50S ribosomal protein L35 [Armatimonadota bacterium]|nr:50S ribosomal protein L35 [Armatimonadota bacterium]